MSAVTIEEVKKTIVVDATPETAFRVFTEQMREWWPLDTHSLFDGRAPVFVEPHVGGRVVERDDTGEEASWGDVLVWEPPSRFAMTWEITKDRGAATEVDVRFEAEGSGTRVELTHRGFERLGDAAERVRASYDSGWEFVLGRFVDGVRS